MDISMDIHGKSVDMDMDMNMDGKLICLMAHLADN